MLKYQKINFHTLTGTIDDARFFVTNTAYFKNDKGTIHKVLLRYLPKMPMYQPSAVSEFKHNNFELEINDTPINARLEDVGDVYEELKESLEI